MHYLLRWLPCSDLSHGHVPSSRLLQCGPAVNGYANRRDGRMVLAGIFVFIWQFIIGYAITSGLFLMKAMITKKTVVMVNKS